MGLGSALLNRRTLAPALLCLVVLVLGAGGDEARLALRYERGAVIGAEYWRLVTAHLVHLGWAHLLLNLAGFLMVWILFSRAFSAPAWLLIALSSIAAIDLGFLFLDPGLRWYVGLSGVLHGLFVAGAVGECWRGIKDGYLLLAFVVAKLLWEQLVGPVPLTQETSGGPVIVNAHFYGAIGGLLAAGAWLFFSASRRSGQGN